MGRKKNFLDKFISEKKLIKELNNNFFIYTYVNVEDGTASLSVNSDFDRFISHKLSKFINDTKYKNIIVIARSEKEQFSEPFPLEEKNQTF